jgi:lipopolysaccharide/colanic/teichoic acid biosynthesis glycosyltransferase
MILKSLFIKSLLVLAADSALFYIALFLALFVRRFDIFSLPYFNAHLFSFLPIYIVFIIGMYILNMYKFPSFTSSFSVFKSIFYMVLFSVFFGNSFFYIFHTQFTPKIVLIMQMFLLFIFVSAFRFFIKKYSFNFSKINAVILDDSKKGEIIKSELLLNDYDINILEDISKKFSEFDNYSIKNILDIIYHSKLKMVILDYSNSKSQNIFPYIYELKSKGVKVLDINYFYEYVYKKVSLDSVNYSWFFKEVKADAKIYEFIKRIIDISLCVPVFLIWLFLHPWVKYVIEKEDAGEVYSIQERLGRYGKKIYIKKYRTMSYTDNGEWLEQSQNKVTEVGKFLRRTRIDELPQIFAVLKGELSFIGPRTDIVNLGQKLASEIDHYNLRYSVTPGLSGWAQVNMNYQPRTVEDSTERLRYDLYYVKHRSVIFDIIIILKTIKTVLSREGS